jgi:hypothetical protein
MQRSSLRNRPVFKEELDGEFDAGFDGEFDAGFDAEFEGLWDTITKHAGKAAAMLHPHKSQTQSIWHKVKSAGGNAKDAVVNFVHKLTHHKQPQTFEESNRMLEHERDMNNRLQCELAELQSKYQMSVQIAANLHQSSIK